MAKLNDRFNAEETARRNSFIKNENMKELKSSLSRFGQTEIPEELANFFNAFPLPRVGAVVFNTFQVVSSGDSVCYGEKSETSVFARLIQKEGKPFPMLLVYSPTIARIQDYQQKESILRRVIKSRAIPDDKVKAMVCLMDVKSKEKEKLLRDMAIVASGEAISPDLKFVLNSGLLPIGLPDQIKVEGSATRMEMLSRKPDVQTFYSEVGTVTCVVHTLKNNDGSPCKVWTFFVPEVNPVLSLAFRLTSIPTNLPVDLAVKISSELPHDQYYRVGDVATDPRAYASAVAFHAGFGDGNGKGTLHDLLQGDVSVFHSSGKYYVDIDDELPSAFLIKGHLNIFVP